MLQKPTSGSSGESPMGRRFGAGIERLIVAAGSMGT
jgi:hypothetical protein